MTTLTFEQLETLYDELATAIDRAGPQREAVFLSKLVLCMAHEWGQGSRISELIEQCLAQPAPSAVDQRLV